MVDSNNIEIRYSLWSMA